MAFPNFKFKIVLQMIFIYVKALFRIWINKFEIILCLFIGIQVFSKTCISCILQSYNFSVSIESKLRNTFRQIFFLWNLFVRICLQLVSICNAIFCLIKKSNKKCFWLNHVDQMSYISIFFFSFPNGMHKCRHSWFWRF